MLSLLRTNQFVGNILLLFYLLLVRLIYFINPQSTASDEYIGGVAWYYLKDSSWTAPGFANLFLTLLITLVIAVGINLLENGHRLTGELNLIPGAMFILLASIFPCFNSLNPALIAVLPIIYILNGLISLYKKANPAKLLFNVGFALSIACLFYPSAIWLLLFIMAGLNLMRAIRLREILMTLCGWLTLFFLAGVYFYWQDRLGYYFETQIGNNFSWMDWQLDKGYNMVWLPMLGLLLIFLLGLAGFQGFQLKKSILAKKAISLLFFYMLFIGLIFLIQPMAGIEHLLLLFPGIGYLLSFILLRNKPATAEIIHILLILVIMAYQLFI